MSNLTMPTLTVAFKQAALTAVARSRKGIVALLIRDAKSSECNEYILSSAAQIPTILGTANQAAIRRVFLGNVNPPKKVLVYVMDADGVIEDGCAALVWLATQKFDYLAAPDDVSAAEAAVLKAWVKTQREDFHATYKVVLPNLEADHEAVVNFAGDGILAGTESFTTAAYCGRIAGLIAGTPMTQSVTYAVLPEVTDITRLTPAAMDEAVAAGKLILYHDGEKVKCGRGVNSLTSTADKGDIWRKIKLVELLDMVRSDIRLTIQDNYIGKYQNSYDNKVLLVTAISDYLLQLVKDGLIQQDFTCEIDVDAQEKWLQENGTDTTEMTAQQIKEANTGTHVFLHLAIAPIDAMEDVVVEIYI